MVRNLSVALKDISVRSCQKAMLRVKIMGTSLIKKMLRQIIFHIQLFLAMI